MKDTFKSFVTEKTEEVNSLKESADTSATTATKEADRAKKEADRAAQNANKVDMSNYYDKAKSDEMLANKADLVEGKVPKNQLPNSVYIPANSNLDTYLETGDYHSPTDAEAATITNAPLKTAFFLHVDMANVTNVRQVITHYPFDNRTFYRLYYAGAWGAWLELARFNSEGHLVLPNGAEFWIE